jgi:hypothetical protein
VSQSPAEQKKTWGVTQEDQYAPLLSRRDARSLKITSGNQLHLLGTDPKFKAPVQNEEKRASNGGEEDLKEVTRNPRASATTNQRLGVMPQILHVPRGARNQRKPLTRGRSQWASTTVSCRPDQRGRRVGIVGAREDGDPKHLDLAGTERSGSRPPCHLSSVTPGTVGLFAPPLLWRRAPAGGS